MAEVEVISWDGDMEKLSSSPWFTAVDEPVRKALTGGFTSALEKQKESWEKEGGFLKDILGITPGSPAGEKEELLKELEGLREEKKKWDAQTSASRDAFEKEISESYPDILGAEAEEPTELFVSLVEKGIDIPIAAKVVRETYSLSVSPAPAKQEVKEEQFRTPRSAGIASRGDTIQGSAPRRPLGARPSIEDLIEASADTAFSSKSSPRGR